MFQSYLYYLTKINQNNYHLSEPEKGYLLVDSRSQVNAPLGSPSALSNINTKFREGSQP